MPRKTIIEAASKFETAAQIAREAVTEEELVDAARLTVSGITLAQEGVDMLAPLISSQTHATWPSAD